MRLLHGIWRVFEKVNIAKRYEETQSRASVAAVEQISIGNDRSFKGVKRADRNEIQVK